MGHFGLPSGSFTVHVHHPEDFLVLFRDYDVLQQILDAPSPPPRSDWSSDVGGRSAG
jgi:hypothetical protein